MPRHRSRRIAAGVAGRHAGRRGGSRLTRPAEPILRPSFDLPAYLQRLGITRPNADAEGVARLQEAQQRAIPFGNLDPLRGIVPTLDIADIVHRLVTRRRGGYCYEQNLLFDAALRAIGLAPVRVLCRVRMRDPSGPVRNHLALLVPVCGSTLLADAGFGGPGPLRPLLHPAGTEDAAPFRLRPIADGTMLERRGDGGWRPLYSFDRTPVSEADVRAANRHSATAEDSPFPRHLMLAGHDGTDRIGVFDRDLTIEGRDGTRRGRLDSAEDLAAIMGRIGFAPDLDHREIWARVA